MPRTVKRKLLIAMSSDRRGQALDRVAQKLQLESEIVTDAEALLFRTRGNEDLPEALIIDHQLAEQVENLDLLRLLRNRQPLAELPVIYLGPPETVVQAAAYNSGADAYVVLPSTPAVISGALARLLERRQRETTLRRTLGRLRDFEQAWRESERVKDDLTHMLVHDLKSPISAVMGLLDHSMEMLDSSDSTADIGELLSLARSESQHLLGLAANILDVRRMKEGHMPFEPNWLENLTALAHQALGDVSGGPRERNFSFLVRPEAESVFADPGLLRRIMANLFGNAVKHTRRNGYVDFRAWKDENGFVLSVRDDGEGIPEADQKRIFNAFEQSRHTVHDRYDTGMGLTFCKMAVEKHGGRIWVESRPGHGSTFFFTLPVTDEDLLTDQPLVELHRD